MKRFCLDVSIVLMAIAFMGCFVALVEGAAPALALLAGMLALAAAIRISYVYSMQLAQQAQRARRIARRRLVIAKHNAALAQAGNLQVCAPAPQNDNGLFVA